MYQENRIEQTFRANYSALCMYSVHFVGDVDIAEDVVMDCFLRYAEKISNGHSVYSPRQYLYQMVKNASIDKAKRKINTISPELIQEMAEDDEDVIARSEREAWLWKEIDRLPPVCQRVFLLSKREGKTHEEISRELAISIKTIEAHMRKAYITLRTRAKTLKTVLL